MSLDHYLISGHRRLKAALASNVKTVPIRVLPISYKHFNTSRDKSDEEKLNEIMAKLNPVETHNELREARELKARRNGNNLSRIDVDDIAERRVLTSAKYPLLNAIIRILNENVEFWPLTVRQIHYRLLGPDAPLTHASKPSSRLVREAPERCRRSAITTSLATIRRHWRPQLRQITLQQYHLGRYR